MKKLIAIVASSLLMFLAIFPRFVLAATNYGDGSYGGGNYNIGDNPVPGPAGAPSCTDTTPSGTAPWLYQANAQNNSSIIIMFTNWQSPVDHFALEYGTSSNKYQFGSGNIGGNGTNSYTVNSLNPNTIYYFRVRAGNGCAPGAWSNEISAKTLGATPISNLGNNLNIVSSNLEPVPNQTPTSPEEIKTQGYTLNVKVKDLKGSPVQGAEVTIHSTVQTQKTDQNGIATFTNVEPGNHIVQIAYNNYQGEQSINLTGDIKEFSLNITIEVKNAFLSPQVLAVVGTLVLIIALLVFKLIIRNKLKKL